MVLCVEKTFNSVSLKSNDFHSSTIRQVNKKWSHVVMCMCELQVLTALGKNFYKYEVARVTSYVVQAVGSYSIRNFMLLKYIVPQL